MENKSETSTDNLLSQTDIFSNETDISNADSFNKTIYNREYFSSENKQNEHVGGFASEKISEIFNSILRKQ